MNQILKFGENDNTIYENQLKFIVYNMVEYECNKYKIKYLNHIKFDKITNFYSWYVYDHDTNYIDFQLDIDISRFGNYKETYADYDYRNELSLDAFFNSLGLDNNDFNMLIFFTLHELGHMYDYNRFYDRLQNRMSSYNNFDSMVESGMKASFPCTSEEEFNKYATSDYYYRPTECFAMMFAFREFYEVWSMLKSRNLI